MLKIVGTARGKVADEKTLIDETDALTPYGLFLVLQSAFAIVGIISLVTWITLGLKKLRRVLRGR